MKLTQEQKRIKLAEFAGWRINYIDGNGLDCDVWIHPDGQQCWAKELAPLPDYFNDLNAVYELELKAFQDSSIQLYYSRSVIRIIKNSAPLDKQFVSDFDLVTATAAQRAEALGLTLNLWTE
jgi:hypothetical protein